MRLHMKLNKLRIFQNSIILGCLLLLTGFVSAPVSKPLPWALKVCRETALGTFLVKRLNMFAIAASFVGCKRNPMSAKMRAAYCAPYNSAANRIATLRFVQDIPLKPEDPGYDIISNVEAGLGRFANLPMTICWGLKDFVFDHHFLKEWQRHFPNADVHTFDDCGHYILEDAADEVIPIIEQFLSANPLDAPAIEPNI